MNVAQLSESAEVLSGVWLMGCFLKIFLLPRAARDIPSTSNTGGHSCYGASLVAETVKTLPAMQETRVQSLGQEDPLERGMVTHSSIFAGEFHGQRSQAGYSPQGGKESDTTERLFHFHAVRNFHLKQEHERRVMILTLWKCSLEN